MLRPPRAVPGCCSDDLGPAGVLLRPPRAGRGCCSDDLGLAGGVAQTTRAVPGGYCSDHPGRGVVQPIGQCCSGNVPARTGVRFDERPAQQWLALTENEAGEAACGCSALTP